MWLVLGIGALAAGSVGAGAMVEDPESALVPQEVAAMPDEPDRADVEPSEVDSRNGTETTSAVGASDTSVAVTTTMPPVTTASQVSSTSAPVPAPTTTTSTTATTTSVTGTSTITTTTIPTTTTTTLPPERNEPRKVLFISDSAAAAIRWQEDATRPLQGAEFTLDLESCRRLIRPSCNGRENYAPTTAIAALSSFSGQDHDTLIMATGYNDTDADFDDAFDLIVAEARAQGIEDIVWATYREDVGYDIPIGLATSYARMNEALYLRAISGNYPELRLLDWRTMTDLAPDWVRSDGVHYSRTGAFGMADMISRELAAMDGRPCPTPWDPGGVAADPCPPPVAEALFRGEAPPVRALHDPSFTGS